MSVIRFFRQNGWLLVGMALLVACTALAVWQVASQRGLDALRQAGQHRLELYAASLDRAIGQYAYLPATLELERDVLDLVAHEQPLGAGVSRRLERLNLRAGTRSIYLLDRHGRVVATSNWNRPDSYMGEDLSYRPYFLAARQRKPGRFFGIGSTRGESGYYLSSPIMSDGELAGVAVVKVGLERLEQSWATVEVPVMVTDRNGVVILSSVPGWKFGTRLPLDAAQYNALRDSQQYGAETLRSLRMPVLRALDDAAALLQVSMPQEGAGDIRSADGVFLAQDAAFGDAGWTLTVLSPAAPVLFLARVQAALAALAVACLCILLVIWRMRRRQLQDRLEAREALQRAHDELERKVEERTRTLKEAQDELVHAGKLAMIGQLSTGLAHELNQPLTALRTLAGNTVKFMARGELGTAQDNLERIGTLVDGMGALTGQLKQFARKSSGTPGEASVGRAIEHALLLLDQRLRQAGAQMRVTLEDDALAVRCDPNRLEQVLINLVANALDAAAAAPAPMVALNACRRGRQCIIAVRDNGPGLPEPVRERLFEPFFTTKDAGAGLGLGLAISMGIIRDSGGTLEGANHPDGGAVFTIHLPVAGAETCIEA